MRSGQDCGVTKLAGRRTHYLQTIGSQMVLQSLIDQMHADWSEQSDPDLCNTAIIMKIISMSTRDQTTNIELAIITTKKRVICLVFCGISMRALEVGSDFCIFHSLLWR